MDWLIEPIAGFSEVVSVAAGSCTDGATLNSCDCGGGLLACTCSGCLVKPKK